MEIAPVVGTALANPDPGARAKSFGSVRGIIIVAAKIASALLIATIALPALVASALIASIVVFLSGAARLTKWTRHLFQR